MLFFPELSPREEDLCLDWTGQGHIPSSLTALKTLQKHCLHSLSQRSELRLWVVNCCLEIKTFHLSACNIWDLNSYYANVTGSEQHSIFMHAGMADPYGDVLLIFSPFSKHIFFISAAVAGGSWRKGWLGMHKEEHRILDSQIISAPFEDQTQVPAARRRGGGSFASG